VVKATTYPLLTKKTFSQLSQRRELCLDGAKWDDKTLVTSDARPKHSFSLFQEAKQGSRGENFGGDNPSRESVAGAQNTDCPERAEGASRSGKKRCPVLSRLR